jgi:hypothetical protein
MAGLDPATQRDRVCGRNDSFRSLMLAGWVAASRAAMAGGLDLFPYFAK